MKTVSMKESRFKKRVFKCPDCTSRFNSNINFLFDHIKEHHLDNIPDGVTIKQYVFNRKYKKTRGSCVIDGHETLWIEAKGRYERYCSEKCRLIARENFKKNALAKLGTENPASTPEHQLNAIKGRSYSGEYKFTTGGLVGYSSSYEEHLLNYVDEEMGFTPKDIDQCEIIFEFELDGVKKFHIPDFVMMDYELIIQVKTFKNMNSNVQGVGKLRQRLADKSIINNGRWNYIVILDKEYDDFVNILQLIKSNQDAGIDEKIICIPSYD